MKCSCGTVYSLSRCESWLRRNPAVRASAAAAASPCSRPVSAVKYTFACAMSAETSTRVTVTMPTRGSLTSVRSKSARSCRICSATRCARCCFIGASQRARDLDDFVHLELVALLHVVEAADRQAALEPGLHLTHVVLEALERVELAVVDDDVVAQHADARAATDDAFEHVAAGDRADLA